MKNYETKILKIDDSLIKKGDIELLKKEPAVKEGAELLKKGELLAFPTETVYGLGADALNPKAVNKIFLSKGRPQDNPLIVHIAELKQLQELMEGELSINGEKLINAFWPGPLTVIVKKRDIIPDETTAGLDSVAVRMPVHPLARAIIEKTGLPVAAPSANASGKPSPTRAVHVYNDLCGKIPLIIDGGAAEVGVESTVVDIRGEMVRILRPGGVSREEIRNVIGDFFCDSLYSKNKTERPVSPGMKYRHYSPETPLYIIENEDMLKVLIESELEKDSALILSDETYQKYYSLFNNVQAIKMGPRSNPELIAYNLFDLLRRIDKLALRSVYIEAIPATGIGEAVMNRIRKAAYRE